jgi:hypothetical protein
VKHGAIPRPDHPAASNAVGVREMVSGYPAPAGTDWFREWKWAATGNDLGNSALSNCVEAADVVLCQGFAAQMGVTPVSGPGATELAEARYAQIAGWNGDFPGNDPGSVPEVDCSAWQTVPIVAGARAWSVRWGIVDPPDVARALLYYPLLLTIGLCEDDADRPSLWRHDPDGPYVDFHRVVCGARDGICWTCRTYGFDIPVSPARVVGADMLVHLDTPAGLQMASIDWTKLRDAA